MGAFSKPCTSVSAQVQRLSLQHAGHNPQGHASLAKILCGAPGVPDWTTIRSGSLTMLLLRKAWCPASVANRDSPCYSSAAASRSTNGKRLLIEFNHRRELGCRKLPETTDSIYSAALLGSKAWAVLHSVVASGVGMQVSIPWLYYNTDGFVLVVSAWTEAMRFSSRGVH